MAELYHGFVTRHGLGVIHMNGTPFHLPVMVTSLKDVNENLQAHGKRTTAEFYINMLMQYTSTPKRMIIGPIGKWIHFPWNEKASNHLKGSLLMHSGDQEVSTSSESTVSVEIKEKELRESLSSPLILYGGLSQEHINKRACHGKWRSESNMSDQMLASCSSSRTTCSCHSKSSKCVPISKGLLHCTWKNGILSFEFLVAGDENEIYFASPWNGTSDGKAPEYIYMFQSRSNCPKGDHANSASHIVGKMKVSSCLTFNSNGSRLIEREFLLYGASEDHQRKTFTPTSKLVKSKVPSKSVANIFKMHYLNQKKETLRSGRMNLENENVLRESCLNELNHMQPSLELAAVIIRHLQNYSKEDKTMGGWGLKFLEGIADDDSSLVTSLVKSYQNVEKEPLRSVNVLVPAGLHGDLVGSAGGPSSLVERWRTGGLCDCSGWDTGCPLTVLHDRAINDKDLTKEESPEQCDTVVLFKEGARQGEPALRMLKLQEGLYAVHFQSNFSALQSFSVGVSLIHAGTPDLCPKL